MDLNNSASKTVVIILVTIVLVISIIMVFNYLSLQYNQSNKYVSGQTTITENMNHLNANTSVNKRLIIYHMPRCGHCSDIMENKQSNGMTKCEELREKLNPHGISVVDYKHGRDEQANKFNSFPNIMIEVNGQEIPYNGSRDVNSIIEAILNTN